MITPEILALYTRFGGDIDAWSRATLVGAIDRSAEEAWTRLDHLIQQATLIRRGLTDEAFKARTEREIEDAAATPEIAAQIWAFAG